MSAKLDINSLKVATACPARWEDMAGDERARFCQHCQKHVYNFSAMTAKEVEELVVAKEGALCGRMYRRRDGTVLTADCPTGKAVVQRKQMQWFAGAVAGLTLFASPLGNLSVQAKSKGDKESSASSRFASQKWEQFKLWAGITAKPVPPPIGPPMGAIMGDICVMPPRPPATTNAPAVQKPSAGGNSTSQKTP